MGAMWNHAYRRRAHAQPNPTSAEHLPGAIFEFASRLGPTWEGSVQVRASGGRALLQLDAPSPPPPIARYAVAFDGVDDYFQLPQVWAPC